MTLEVEPASPSDAPQMVRVFQAAFSNAFNRTMFPPTEDVRVWAMEHLVGGNGAQPREVFLKVRDEEGKVAAFAKWIRPRSADPDGREEEEVSWPASSDVELYLDIIAVDPAYQGRGLASKLLKWGLARADEEGIEVYLSSSPEGRRMYEKYGFESKDSFSPFPGTGVTEYVGGDALATLVAKHPEFSYSAMVRSTQKAEQVMAQYPNTRVMIGDLDDSALLERESAAADIVLHTADASDHVGPARAIATDLVAGHGKGNAGYWLHMGGTGILTFEDSDKNEYGTESDKVYNDWSGVKGLLTLPDHAFHHDVDQLVLEAGANHADVLKTALVCPRTIYSEGHAHSAVARSTSSRTRHSDYINGPSSALDDSSGTMSTSTTSATCRTDDDLWGAKAYYLKEHGEHVWGELAQSTAEAGTKLGYLAEIKAETIVLESAKKYAGFELLGWRMNSPWRAQRARAILGWKPYRPSLLEELPTVVRSELERMQK
ncbi:uncharacterized protein N7498_000177 [Penicillium cinerascens]|uniref:N-acetyltransferase domain-containing protein n=1 Tax=Penicillium cinerascens TaxID=70096 RepID=A0A9W9NGC3_9EURO|nr:uncharacterized protein N7498_000177 [Penicillium cinerascens]KAJ5218078.1 hypothetical protein N7498_000177 [Penicillium cinerascens]